MRKIVLNSSDWKTILLGATGFHQMEDELYSIMKSLANRSDVVIILTEDDKPEMVIKYDENTDKFSEYSIDN
jgi:adenosine/AMP kinase